MCHGDGCGGRLSASLTTSPEFEVMKNKQRNQDNGVKIFHFISDRSQLEGQGLDLGPQWVSYDLTPELN